MTLDVGDGAIVLLDVGGQRGQSGQISQSGQSEHSEHSSGAFTSPVVVVVGHTFSLRFRLLAERKRRHGPYKIVVRRGSLIIGRKMCLVSGVHTMELSLDLPGVFVLDVTSTNAHAQTWSTSFVVDYNTRVASSMVSMITIPMIVVTFFVVLMTASRKGGGERRRGRSGGSSQFRYM